MKTIDVTVPKKGLAVEILGGLTFVMVLLSLWAIFIYVPTERVMGIVQKIFYYHVSLGFNTFLAFFIVFIYSILYLWKRDFYYDIVAHAAAEVGIVLCSLVLITGPIWAKPIWGTWWTWDARLTTTLILWMIYIAYLMLRSAAGSDAQKARYAAVFGIVGFVDVPIVYFSIHWWRTIHPVVIKASGMSLAPEMKQTMFISLAAITLLHIFILTLRVKVGLAKHTLEGLKIKLTAGH
ncbi:MAG: cytochrome c biogenesis protein CcsA [Candidatus Schekmanbacteria bacterium]|nr:cytochrome c biogenesis protein CcsA [Candidatus Schekmanbacteria bacterium]